MLKLSAAIRIGSMTTRPIRGQYKDDSNGRCALGAAMDAVGMKIYNNSTSMGFYKKFPIASKFAFHPVDQRSRNTIYSIIWELNDLHYWSRERIADWVEKQEADQELEEVIEKLETSEVKI